MASEGYHEPVSELDEAVIDRHRAIQSIMEELEAVDWYDQRVAATEDRSLAAMLAHNRDEEKEHAAMGIEWLRRNDDTFDEQLRTYLFTDEPITEVEHAAERGDSSQSGSDPTDHGRPDDGPADDPTHSLPAGHSHSLDIGGLKDEGQETPS